MAYEPQIWNSGNPELSLEENKENNAVLVAEKMNNIEQGIKTAHDEIANIEIQKGDVETALGYSPLDPTDLTWDNLSNKPTTFTPSAHSHSWEQVTGKPSTFPAATHSHSWADVTSKPSTFTPSAHTHTIADVTGLQSAIDEKAGKEVATTQVSGLMSSSDKTKLNGLSSDATTLQGKSPSNFIEVVNHGTSGNYARPVGGISVLWIGTVEPQNAIDNDIWIGG